MNQCITAAENRLLVVHRRGAVDVVVRFIGPNNGAVFGVQAMQDIIVAAYQNPKLSIRGPHPVRRSENLPIGLVFPLEGAVFCIESIQKAVQ